MFHSQQDYLDCVDDKANIVTKCDARRQVIAENIPSSLSRCLDRLKSYMMTVEYLINATTFLKKQRELCMFSPLPALCIDMDETRMFHFQQVNLGCVDDEANIVKKCDARRQVTSDNISPSLSRWLDRLMSVMMTPAVYAIIVPTVFVSKNTLCCYDEQNKLGRYDEMFARCCDVCYHCTCSWIRQVYPELCLPAAIATLLIKQRKRAKKKVGNRGDKKNKMLHSLP